MQKVAFEINDEVILLSTVMSYAAGAKENLLIPQGAKCIVAEFSYIKGNKDAAIIEYNPKNSHRSFLATVEFEMIKKFGV